MDVLDNLSDDEESESSDIDTSSSNDDPKDSNDEDEIKPYRNPNDASLDHYIQTKLCLDYFPNLLDRSNDDEGRGCHYDFKGTYQRREESCKDEDSSSSSSEAESSKSDDEDDKGDVEIMKSIFDRLSPAFDGAGGGGDCEPDIQKALFEVDDKLVEYQNQVARQFRRSQPLLVYAAATGGGDGKKATEKKGGGDKKPEGPKAKPKADTKPPPPGPANNPFLKPKNVQEAMEFHHPEFEVPEHLRRFDKYYQFTFNEKFPKFPDRDSQWMELSDTNEEDEREIVESLNKALKKPKWMRRDISYESQRFVKDMSAYSWLGLITGRVFYYLRPNKIKGHMEFATSFFRMLPFFLSTLFLWCSLVTIVGSYTAINFPPQSEDEEGRIRQVEKLEIHKYSEAFYFVMVNLVFMAVWSVLVILRDGQRITHYMNCWLPALGEMETSASLSIKKIIRWNFFIWLLPSGILVLCYFMEFPKHISGVAGLVGMLVGRVVEDDIRFKDDVMREYRMFGLGFIIYVLFSTRMVFCFLQIVALLIKNSSEQWNLKFALTFNQLLLNKGRIQKRLGIKLPLHKLFTHHRLLTALIKAYGATFGLTVMIYLGLQVGLITYILVQLFNYKAETAADYKGQDDIRYFRAPNPPKKDTHIPFFHAAADTLTTNLLVLGLTLVDYIFTTEVLAAASNAFQCGFEFVRRTNLVLCKTSHQRRVVQSLLWSFADTDPTLLSAGGYFAIDRSTVAAGLGAAVAFFSLIIQLQRRPERIFVSFRTCSEFDRYTKELPDRCGVGVFPVQYQGNFYNVSSTRRN